MIGNRRESIMEREREMMGFEEKTRTVQDDLDNIAKVENITSLQFTLLRLNKMWFVTINLNMVLDLTVLKKFKLLTDCEYIYMYILHSLIRIELK